MLLYLIDGLPKRKKIYNCGQAGRRLPQDGAIVLLILLLYISYIAHSSKVTVVDSRDILAQ